jgi:hypothetical protein
MNRSEQCQAGGIGEYNLDHCHYSIGNVLSFFEIHHKPIPEKTSKNHSPPLEPAWPAQLLPGQTRQSSSSIGMKSSVPKHPQKPSNRPNAIYRVDYY